MTTAAKGQGIDGAFAVVRVGVRWPSGGTESVEAVERDRMIRIVERGGIVGADTFLHAE